MSGWREPAELPPTAKLTPELRRALLNPAPPPPFVVISLSPAQSELFMQRWRSRLAAAGRCNPGVNHADQG